MNIDELITKLEISSEELKAFERFNETTDDGEGYDVPKEMMKRLADIGLLNNLSAGYYRATNLGLLITGCSLRKAQE